MCVYKEGVIHEFGKIRHISLANTCKIERGGKDMLEDVFVWQDVSRTHTYFSEQGRVSSDRFKNTYMSKGFCLDVPHEHQPWGFIS